MTVLETAQELELLRKTANLVQVGHMLTASGMVWRHFRTVEDATPFLDKLKNYLPADTYKDFADLIIILLE